MLSSFARPSRLAHAIPLVVAAVLATASGCNLFLGLNEYRDCCQPIGVGEPGQCIDCTTGNGGGMSSSTGMGNRCTPGDTRSCWTGDNANENVGICKDGTETCKADGSGWAACEGEVLPKAETCESTKDEDCNGLDCVEWAVGIDDVEVRAVARDPVSGDLLAFGRANDKPAKIGATKFDPSTDGWLFLARMHADGSGLSAIPLGAGAKGGATGILVDGSGDILLGGNLLTPCSFGNDVVPAGQFVIKLNPTGTKLMWQRPLGDAEVHLIAIDMPGPTMAFSPSGDVVIAGVFYNSINFGDGDQNPPTAHSLGLTSGYVALLDGKTGAGSTGAQGNTWGTVFSNVVEQTSVAASSAWPKVAVDHTGRGHLAFSFANTTTLAATSATFSAAGGADILIDEFSTTAGSASAPGLSGLVLGDNADQIVAALAAGPDGSWTAAGTFSGTMQIPDSPTTYTTLTAAVPGEGFVISVAASGVLKWSQLFGTTGFVQDLAIDTDGKSHIFGWFRGTLALGSQTVDGGQGNTPVLAVFDPAGSPLWDRGYLHTADPYLVGRIASGDDGSTFLGIKVQAWPLDLGTGNLTTSGPPIASALARYAP